MTNFQLSSHKPRNSRGVSLIIVLIMMVIIGITAATAMRSATSEQRATNNQRVEATALQYAEAALRYCESELIKPDGSRISSLQSANIVNSTPGSTAWEDVSSWPPSVSGGAAASRTEVPDPQLQITASEVALPTKKPECVVENMAGYGYVVTARGFSPDYHADGTGKTDRGAVVWLQSFTQ